MSLVGEMLLGQQCIIGSGAPIQAINPATNEKLEPVYFGGGLEEVEQAAKLAWSAFDEYRETPLGKRAEFLRTIASEMELLDERLVERVMAETGLPKARVEGELARTCLQLRLFADVVESGDWFDVRVEPALPDRQPLPRLDMRLRQIPLGPVVVFGASNFPLAFSVAGGDTASALAAGCPVIVKAHSAHPGTSELVGKAVQKAVAKTNMPEGVFSMLFGSGREVGAKLVAHEYIKAVGFTGSFSGGKALMDIAYQRKEPIPVFAEMSSSNPVFLLKSALKNGAEALAKTFVTILNNCAGQFCTSPGLIVAEKSEALNTFLDSAITTMTESTTQTMLTPNIYSAYEQGVSSLAGNANVQRIAQAQASNEPNQCRGELFKVSAQDFVSDETLHEEVFGSAAIIIECDDMEDMVSVAECLEGQLTATVHAVESDFNDAKRLLPTLERKAGRLLLNGWPPGLEVNHATVHGGPFPATSDSKTTSVGSSAINRFLRPVCYQSFPDTLLPEVLKHNNPFQVTRRYNGLLETKV